MVSYESIRRWCAKFRPDYAQRLRQRQGRLGDTWFLDELFVPINGERRFLWRAVDKDGDVRMCCNFQKSARERLVESTRLRLM